MSLIQVLPFLSLTIRKLLYGASPVIVPQLMLKWLRLRATFNSLANSRIYNSSLSCHCWALYESHSNPLNVHDVGFYIPTINIETQ